MSDEIQVVTAPTAEPANPPLDSNVSLRAIVKVTKQGAVRAGFRRPNEDPKPDPSVDGNKEASDEFEVKRVIQSFRPTDVGRYELWAEFDGTEIAIPEVNVIELSAPADRSPSSGANGAAMDLRGLVWDPSFAQATGYFVAALLVSLLAVCLIGAGFLIGKDITPEDVAGVVSLLGVVVGSVAVIGGVWLIALELRGRSPNSKTSEGAAEAPIIKGFAADQIEAASKLTDSIGKLRSPIAALIAGAGIFVVVALLAGSVANVDLAEPTTPDTDGQTQTGTQSE